MRFFGERIRKIVHLSSSLPCKFTGLAIFPLDLAWQNIRSWKRKFRWLFCSVYLKSFLQKNRQKHWHVRITSLVYHFCNSGTRFWTQIASSLELLADTVLVYKLFVFHSSWILGQYERNIVLIYIYCVLQPVLSWQNNPFSDFAFLWRRRIHMIWDHKSVFGFSQRNTPIDNLWKRVHFGAVRKFFHMRKIK